MDKIRLSRNIRKITEIRVKINIINKSNRNDNSMSDFLSSPFSSVMANLTAASSAGKSVSLTDKKTESL